MYDNPQFVDSETDIAWTGYQGPERRAGAAPQSHCLKRMLDEIDYGMLLVSADQQVLYLNHAAWLELDGEHPLQIIGHALRAQRGQDVAPLHEALVAARRGLRKLLTLGCAEQRVTVSVVPLTAGAQPQAAGQGQSILLVLGKRQVCQSLALQGLARELRLTAAEARVFEQLCGGVRPAAIARQLNVQVSTVRTQVGSIRAKAGAASIGALLRQVAVLPPMVGALRLAAAQAAR